MSRRAPPVVSRALPRRNHAVDVARLPLKPAEAFVLAQLDGASDLDELAAITNLGEDDLTKTLSRLVSLGALHGDEATVERPSARRIDPRCEEGSPVIAEERLVSARARVATEKRGPTPTGADSARAVVQSRPTTSARTAIAPPARATPPEPITAPPKRSSAPPKKRSSSPPKPTSAPPSKRTTSPPKKRTSLPPKQSVPPSKRTTTPPKRATLAPDAASARTVRPQKKPAATTPAPALSSQTTPTIAPKRSRRASTAPLPEPSTLPTPVAPDPMETPVAQSVRPTPAVAPIETPAPAETSPDPEVVISPDPPVALSAPVAAEPLVPMRTVTLGGELETTSVEAESPASATPAATIEESAPPVPEAPPQAPPAVTNDERPEALSPAPVPAQENEKLALFQAAAEKAFSERDWGTAANAARAALALGPADERMQMIRDAAATRAAGSTAGSYASRAAHEEKNGNWEAAARAYQRVAEAAPQDAATFAKAAECWVRAEMDAKSAVRLARKAVGLDPGAVGYRLTLVRAYEAAGMIESAMGELGRAQAMAPGDSTLVFWMGRLKGRG